jgi:hypothetical protein
MRRRSFLFAAAGAGAVAQSGVAGYFAIQNATIHPVSGPSIARGTLVVRGGLIEAVGADVAAPAGAWTIDGAGLHVYPGLIDALSRWGLSADPPTAPARGRGDAPTTADVQFQDDGGPEERSSNTSWLKAADLLKPEDAALTAARNAGYTTAVVFPQTGIFAGQGAALNLNGGRSGEMVVLSPAGQFLTVATRGYATFPGSLMGSFAYIRQMFLDAAHYKEAKAVYAANPRGLSRPAYDRALEGLLESPRVLLPASRKVEIERMLRFGKELGTPFVLYGGTEAWRSAEALRTAGVPLLINLRWPERDLEADPEAEESLRTLEAREMAPAGPVAMVKAGAQFAFYSGGVERPADIRRAVRKAVAAGLSQDAALRAMTLEPARIFGLDDRLGSLETGKIANLFITDNEWLEERAKVKMIFVDGKKFAPAGVGA